jgi:hypothetical protein
MKHMRNMTTVLSMDTARGKGRNRGNGSITVNPTAAEIEHK